MATLLLVIVSLAVLAPNGGFKAGVEAYTAVSKTMAQKLVDDHNSMRREEGSSDMNELVWDDNLAKQSGEWADKCQFHHDFSASAKSSAKWPQGQNLYAKTGNSNVYAAVTIWHREKPFYDLKTMTCSHAPCGHYTAVVWSTTKSFGCAYTNCSTLVRSKAKDFKDATYVVCQYFPAGNVRGVVPYYKGAACSKCDNYRAFCDKTLCQPECKAAGGKCKCLVDTPCPYCQKRDPTTCKCICMEGMMGDNCEDPCGDRDNACQVYWGYPKKYRPQMCAVKSVAERCLNLCGKCKPMSDKNWKCGSDTYDTVFKKFEGGTIKEGECVYPYKKDNIWHGKEDKCFKDDKGVSKCATTSNYDKYRLSAAC